MMLKLKIELTGDESDLLRYLIFQSTDFTAFNAKVFLTWLNGSRNKRIKELIKINAPQGNIYPERSFPSLLKGLVTICYNFGTNFVTNSLQPFLYESDNIWIILWIYQLKLFLLLGKKLDLESLKTFLKTANLEFDQNDFLELQFYLANNNYLSLDDYQNLNQAKFFIDIDNLLKCIQDNFKMLNLEDKHTTNELFFF